MKYIPSLCLIALVTFGGSARGDPIPPDPVVGSGRASRLAVVERDHPVRPPLPRGRSIGSTPRGVCLDLLRAYGVDSEELGDDEARGVEVPVRLGSAVGDVTITSPSRASINRVYDCRLVLALLVWSEDLREAGVVGIDHVSTYRPGARVRRVGPSSGHARAMAIDVARFLRRDGSVLDVEELWADARRGQDPCDGVGSERGDLAVLRGLVCSAVEREIFQIVLTPHYDQPHRNHVHLELRPDVDWTYVR